MNKDKHIPQGYKDSPLGIIPKEWEVKRICDFGKVVTGSTPPTNDVDNYGSAYMFVGPVDITESKYIKSTEKYLSEKGFSISRNMPKGSVLFTCIGSTIGKCAIADENLTSNQQINAVICNSNHNEEFLYYELTNRSNKIRLIAGEQAVPIINKSTFENIRILCPPLIEQERIVSVLGLWDTAIEKQSELIEKLKLRKRALMQQLLTGKKRLPDFSEEWKEVKLGEIVSFSTQTIETAKIYKERYVGTENMLSDCNGIILYDKDIPYIQVREYKDGDILMSNIRPYLKKIWLSNCDGGCSTDIHVIRNKVNERVNTKFLYYVLMLDTFFEYAMSGAKGSKMPRGDAKMLTKYPICYPPITEQLAIINILTDADKEIELAKEKLANLQSQKRGLMQQLLTGKKRIK